MSVRTTADEKVDSIREHIDGALKDLSEILVDECDGHDEFNESFTDKLDLAFEGFRKMKKMLDK